MEINSSYCIEIKHLNRIFDDTISIYRNALSFVVKVVDAEWTTISSVSGVNRCGVVRNLIHTTKSNQAKYKEFDKQFYKLPAFLLTSIIKESVGIVSAYRSSYAKWVVDKNGKAPKLQADTHKLPTFYRDSKNMFDGNIMESDTVKLKLYRNNDWVFVPVQLKHTDLNYIRKYYYDKKMSNPTLVKKNKKVFLRFCFTEKVELSSNKNKILAVDLGVNTDAVCSVIDKKGTILARKFINFSSEKDHLYHTLNKIKKQQKKYNNHNVDKLWRIANNRNEELSKSVANAIVEYANEQQVDYIVFEHLNIKGKRMQRVHLWRKKDIQNRVEQKAHRFGIHISRVNPANTSCLAYDGSGKVARGKDAGFKNNKLCQFTNGKIYNCDLNGSYNIGARFFLRELKKSFCVSKGSSTEIEILGSKSRLLWTLDDLRKVS